MSKCRLLLIQDPKCTDFDVFNTYMSNFCKQQNLQPNEIQMSFFGEASNNILGYQFARNAGTEPLQWEGLAESSLDSTFQGTHLVMQRKKTQAYVLICVRPNEKFGIVNLVKQLAQKYSIPYSIVNVPFSTKYSTSVSLKTKKAKTIKKSKPIQKSKSVIATSDTSYRKSIPKQLPPFVFANLSKSRSHTLFSRDLNINQEISKITNYIPTSDECVKIPFRITDEQQLFLDYANMGYNILIQSCVGGGKTTMLQQFVEDLPDDRKAVFLTFNKHLKIDILSQITNTNVLVANYHGLAYRLLDNINIHVKVDELLSTVIEKCPMIPHYDVVIIDEFQDLDTQCAKIVSMILEANPNVQIIVAGGMEQKNRTSSALNAQAFIEDVLGVYKTIQFSKSWRLSSYYANLLSDLWEEPIVGMNNHMHLYTASMDEVVDILGREKPRDVMVIGTNYGMRTKIQNALENRYPSKYNEYTMHISSSEYDPKLQKQTEQAVFTNYNSCKGMERKVVVITDFTIRYFTQLLNSGMEPDIIRNLLCVAISRASQKLIFVQDPTSEFLTIDNFKMLTQLKPQCLGDSNYNISSMLNTAYKESVNDIIKCLDIRKRNVIDDSKIELSSRRTFIDVSILCGIFQEANFFYNYSIEKDFLRFPVSREELQFFNKQSLEKQILLLAAKQTQQQRYCDLKSFIDPIAANCLNKRLSTLLDRDMPSQVFAHVCLKDGIVCQGYADAVSSDCVYELKYCNSMRPEYYVQCAMYMLALDKDKGLLWNTKDNTQEEIIIKDKELFKDAVIRAITKEKNDFELTNKKASSSIAIVNPISYCECTLSVLNKTNGEVLIEETKIHNMGQGLTPEMHTYVLDAYSVNKVFVTENIENMSFMRSLSGYQVYDVSSFVSQSKEQHANIEATQVVLNILQDNVDLSKYQYKSMVL